jgi:hypothetical protein
MRLLRCAGCESRYRGDAVNGRRAAATHPPARLYPAVPDELREEAAREIFERLDLFGPKVVAVYPRAEHAWLLGMAAKKSEDLYWSGREDSTRPIPNARSSCLLL